MARITAGLTTAHVPAIGMAVDLGKTEEPYWKPVFDGYTWTRRWIEDNPADVVILVYNDHADAFSLDLIPTFAIGCADRFEPCDEGYGPRPVPVVQGHPDLAIHLVESLILAEFDITVINELAVDHGLTVPLSLVYGQPDAWPTRVIPLAVNVVQYPQPTGRRCLNLGKAIRSAVQSYADFDHAFLDRIVEDPENLALMPHLEYLREAGSEGIELIMWLIMRGAMGENVRELRRFYHVPASNTAVGHLVVEPV
jgi:protocatechuate 4,5-dioxygenase, beta chain